jgi:hypothetical protein
VEASCKDGAEPMASVNVGQLTDLSSDNWLLRYLGIYFHLLSFNCCFYLGIKPCVFLENESKTTIMRISRLGASLRENKKGS